MTKNCKICSGELKVLYNNLYDDRYGFPGKYSVLVCTFCGFGQLNPEPSSEVIAQIYTDYYPRRNITPDDVLTEGNYRGSIRQRISRYLLGLNNIAHHYTKPGSRVLDVGCGSGASLVELKELGSEGYGTEYDTNIKAVAKKLGLKIHFGDLRTVTWPDNFFDYITMSQLIEHVPDPVEFLVFARKKLKPGGKIIMSFPNFESANRKATGRNWINWHIPYHFNFFTRKSLGLLANKTGLKIERLKTITPMLWMHLQFDINTNPVKAGLSSPVWKNKVTRNRFETIMRKLKMILLIPYYRWLDAIGKGDSWVLIASIK